MQNSNLTKCLNVHVVNELEDGSGSLMHVQQGNKHNYVEGTSTAARSRVCETPCPVLPHNRLIMLYFPSQWCD